MRKPLKLVATYSMLLCAMSCAEVADAERVCSFEGERAPVRVDSCEVVDSSAWYQNRSDEDVRFESVRQVDGVLHLSRNSNFGFYAPLLVEAQQVEVHHVMSGLDLPNLAYVEADLEIAFRMEDGGTSVEVFPSLQTVGGDLRLLTSQVSSITELPALASIGGDLVVRADAMTRSEFDNLTARVDIGGEAIFLP